MPSAIIRHLYVLKNNDGAVVYCGSTSSPGQRCKQHRNRFPDLMMECLSHGESADIYREESEYIHKYKPSMNGKGIMA